MVSGQNFFVGLGIAFGIVAILFGGVLLMAFSAPPIDFAANLVPLFFGSLLVGIGIATVILVSRGL